jgi:MFS family permease
MAIFDKYCQRLGIEKDLIAVKAVFFLYYAGASAIMPYLFLHFYSIPLTVEEIGFLSALRPFTTFVCAPLWSVIADKYRLHKKVLLGAILVVMSLRFLFTTITKARYIAVVILVDEMIGSSVAPLLDAGALEVLGAARKDQYGRQRLWAGLGWGLTATAVGSISSACNLSFRFNYLVYVCFTIMAWAVAARFLNPSAEPNPPSAGSSTTGAATNEKVGVSAPPQRGEFFRNIKRILSSKAAALFAIATLSIGMATAVASTYNTVWVIELGGSSMIAGWMFFAAMCSELTFFWFETLVSH